jgi:transposase InsO family protein
MQQTYHANAATNVNIRRQIQNNFSASNANLAKQFGTSAQTVSKWKNRSVLTDRSSRPKNIAYALSEQQQALIVSVRKSTWFALDEVWEMFLTIDKNISRSSVYRCFKKNNLNAVPQKEKFKKFKEYEPGFLHVDVTYLPKFNGTKYYLFVAIDRTTRALFYKVYENKTAASTQDFFDKCMDFFPFKITHILTDNGLEFTNKLLRSKQGKPCEKPSLLDVKCKEHDIEHRLTLPATPKTNGMVERANGIIKAATVLKIAYKNAEEMKTELDKFLIYYHLERRHGSLRKELKVKTPFEAIKKWYELKPETFNQHPTAFRNKILSLRPTSLFDFHQQPCET